MMAISPEDSVLQYPISQHHNISNQDTSPRNRSGVQQHVWFASEIQPDAEHPKLEWTASNEATNILERGYIHFVCRTVGDALP
jgi:hypothetical protein